MRPSNDSLNRSRLAFILKQTHLYHGLVLVCCLTCRAPIGEYFTTSVPVHVETNQSALELSAKLKSPGMNTRRQNPPTCLSKSHTDPEGIGTAPKMGKRSKSRRSGKMMEDDASRRYRGVSLYWVGSSLPSRRGAPGHRPRHPRPCLVYPFIEPT